MDESRQRVFVAHSIMLLIFLIAVFLSPKDRLSALCSIALFVICSIYSNINSPKFKTTISLFNRIASIGLYFITLVGIAAFFTDCMTRNQPYMVIIATQFLGWTVIYIFTIGLTIAEFLAEFILSKKQGMKKIKYDNFNIYAVMIMFLCLTFSFFCNFGHLNALMNHVNFLFVLIFFILSSHLCISVWHLPEYLYLRNRANSLLTIGSICIVIYELSVYYKFSQGRFSGSADLPIAITLYYVYILFQLIIIKRNAPADDRGVSLY